MAHRATFGGLLCQRHVLGLLTLGVCLTAADTLARAGALLPLYENYRLSYAWATATGTALGVVASVAGTVAAPAFDELPVAPLLVLGLALIMAARTALASILWRGGSVYLFVGTLVGVGAGELLAGLPQTFALQRAVRQYARGTHGQHLEVRFFALVYALRNGAAGLGNLAVDALRTRPASTVTAANMLGLALAALVTSVGAGAALMLALPALWRQDKRTWHGREMSDVILRARPRPWLRRVRATLRNPAFWRFAGVCTLLLGANMAFVHMDGTLTMVMQRTLGERANFAWIQMLDAFVPAVAVPLFQFLLATQPPYRLFAWGTTASVAAFVPLLVMGTAPPLWAYVLFMVGFALAESVWAARFTPYALQAAPPGRAGMFLALASLTSLAMRPLVSWISVTLVAHYCPPAAAVSCDARAVWAWVAGIAATTPLGLWIGYRWLADKVKA